MCVVWGWMGVCVKKETTKRGRELPCKKELNPRAGKLRAVQVRKETFKSTLWTHFKAWNKWRWKGYRQKKMLNVLPQLLSFPWVQYNKGLVSQSAKLAKKELLVLWREKAQLWWRNFPYSIHIALWVLKFEFCFLSLGFA